MKHIRLIKLCPEIQLAHLYEHLYLSEFINFCHNHNLLSYIDYRWHGKTHHGGFVFIEIILLTPKAKELASSIPHLQPEFDEESIEDGLTEIWAEKGKFVDADRESIVSELKGIQAQPWITFEEFDILSHNVRRSSRIVWETEKKIRTKVLNCELILQNDFAQKNKRLLPLFKVIADTINSNLFNFFENDLHCFWYEDQPVYNSKNVKEVSKYRVLADPETPRLTTELATCQSIILDMLKDGFISRVKDYLHKNIPRTEFVRPDELELYEICGVLIGDNGWKEIATKENIEEIIQHTTLQLVFNKEKQQLALSDIFKKKL